MKTQTIILFLALCMSAPLMSEAQLGNFIKNRASKILNGASKEKTKEATNQIDSVAQKAAMDAGAAAKQAEETRSKENQSGPEGMDFSKFLGGKVESKYKDEYSFTSRLYMVTETYNKKETMKIDLYMYFSANSPTVGMETKSLSDEKGKTMPINSSMVMDGENKCFIILTDMNGTKMGLISAIPDEKNTPDEKKPRKTYATDFHKTGNTKDIAGYSCDEYSYTNPESKTTGKLWFTRDANLRIDKRGWSKTGMGDYYGYSEFEGGVILGMDGYDEKGNLTMKMEAKEINPSFSHSITVKGITLRQMNFNMGQQGQHGK